MASTGELSGNESDSAKSSSSQNVNTRPRKPEVKPATISTPSTSSPTNAVHHIKIPPFWPEKPAIWFAQIEGQFAIYKITDDTTKFYHILGNLDRQYATEVEDILLGPPDYNRLKEELIKRLSVSRENKVKQLLMHEELGSRKPSQFLRHLQHLAGPQLPADFIKTVWTSRLPTGIQPIVASQTSLSLEELAELADRINDITSSSSSQQVAAASPSSSSSPIVELTRQVAELTRQVSALTTQDHNRSRSRERGQGYRNRSPSRRSDSCYRRFPVCWYHSSFGAQARKCLKPCDYKAGNAPGSQ